MGLSIILKRPNLKHSSAEIVAETLVHWRLFFLAGSFDVISFEADSVESFTFWSYWSCGVLTMMQY